MKDAVIQTAQDALQQKTALASMGSGVLSITTSFVDGVTPFLPLMSFIAMIVFGALNYRLNKRAKLGKKH